MAGGVQAFTGVAYTLGGLTIPPSAVSEASAAPQTPLQKVEKLLSHASKISTCSLIVIGVCFAALSGIFFYQGAIFSGITLCVVGALSCIGGIVGLTDSKTPQLSELRGNKVKILMGTAILMGTIAAAIFGVALPFSSLPIGVLYTRIGVLVICATYQLGRVIIPSALLLKASNLLNQR